MSTPRAFRRLAKRQPLALGTAVMAAAVLILAIVLLGVPQRLTMTVDALSETARVRVPACLAPQVLVLPPGRFATLETENIDPDDPGAGLGPIRIDGPSLMRVRGPGELEFAQASDGGFTISGSPVGDEGGSAPSEPLFEVKDSDDRIRVRANQLSFSSSIRAAEAEPNAAGPGVPPRARTSPPAPGAAALPRFALRGELVVGSPPRDANWDDDVAVAARPGGLLKATVLGRERGWTSGNRFEVVREQLVLGDQLFTDVDSTGAPACEPGPAWSAISVVPDPDSAEGRPYRFEVVAHARRGHFLVRRGGGAEFRIGASVLESLLQQSIVQTLWAAIVVLALLLTLLTDFLSFASSRQPKRSRSK